VEDEEERCGAGRRNVWGDGAGRVIIMRPGLGLTKNPRGYAVLCTPDLRVYLFSINISADASITWSQLWHCWISKFPQSTDSPKFKNTLLLYFLIKNTMLPHFGVCKYARSIWKATKNSRTKTRRATGSSTEVCFVL